MGKTKINIDIRGYCLAVVDVSPEVSSSYNWHNLQVIYRFVGTKPLEEMDEYNPLVAFSNQGHKLGTNQVVGYSDAKIILRSELSTSSNVIIKTQYDTIQAPGCGAKVPFLLKIN